MPALLILLNCMQIHILHLGFIKASAVKMIKPLTIEDIGLKYDIDPEGDIRLALNALLIISDERVVLIDPGCADFLPSRIMNEYGLEIPEPIESILQSKGIVPEQVTDVIFTHLHFDHGSGAFMRKPGKIVKRFPKARYHVLKEHYEYASRPHPSEASSFFTFLFKYIDGVHWLEDWDFEWMTFKIYNGHTKGMVVPVIRSGREEIFYVSDLLPMHIFLNKEIFCGYDLDPDLIKTEKLDFLSEINKSSKIIFNHDTLIDSMYYP